MKSKTVRLGRSIGLSILFCIVIFSLAGGHGGHNPGMLGLHVIAGLMLMIGAAVHLWTNREWFRSVTSRPVDRLPKQVRKLRRTDVRLAVASLCTLISGLLLLASRGTFPGHLVHALHALSGATMALTLFIHLLQHWGWLKATLRSMNRSSLTSPWPSPKGKETDLPGL